MIMLRFMGPESIVLVRFMGPESIIFVRYIVQVFIT